EVARRLVEAVLVLDVVDDVVPVEQVDHRRRAVVGRRLVEVDGGGEDQRRAAARAAACVRRVVGVGVGVGVDVVALGVGELGAGGAVGGVPAPGGGAGGRRGAAGHVRIDHRGAAVGGRRRRGVARVLDRHRIDAVLGIGDPV